MLNEIENVAPERYGGSFQTWPTRTRFYPLDPRLNEIHIEDMAWSLAGEGRWSNFVPMGLGINGESAYSVAQHSVLASYLVDSKAEKIGMLVHDGAEAYGFRDVASPLKHDPAYALPNRYQDNLQLMILRKYAGLIQMSQAMRDADRIMAVTECLMLFDELPYWWSDLYKATKPAKWEQFKGCPLNPTRCWSRTQAYAAFIRRFRELTQDFRHE